MSLQRIRGSNTNKYNTHTLSHHDTQVVDETDRLLRQSYQEWLPHTLSQLRAHTHYSHAWCAALSACSLVTPSASDPLLASRAQCSGFGSAGFVGAGFFDGNFVGGSLGDANWQGVGEVGANGSNRGAEWQERGAERQGGSERGRREQGVSSWEAWGGSSAATLNTVTLNTAGVSAAPALNTAAEVCMPYGQPRPVKVVVSATLTRDPSKLQRLELHCPRCDVIHCLLIAFHLLALSACLTD